MEEVVLSDKITQTYQNKTKGESRSEAKVVDTVYVGGHALVGG